MVRRCSVFAGFYLLVAASALRAQAPRIALEPVISGLSSPVFLTNAKDGTNRRFIVEQAGVIRVMQPGAPVTTVFLDITSRVLFGGERGLLGLAFHPQFAVNRRFYVNYTRRPDGATVVAEYRVSVGNTNIADNAETVLLMVPQPFENHNGGMIEFGPDGLLYVGMGDGGSGNDPGNRAQNLEELLGKMLRLNIEAPGRPEIFAYGFRNPWRFSFDRLTAQLYAADVGQNAREEVDIVVQGGNYGWRVWEGNRCTNLGPAPCNAPGFIPPILDYANTGPDGRCSIIGGYVYRGAQASLPYGAYVYGDLCSGEIFTFKDGVQTVLLDTTYQISSFGEDEAGEIYVLSLAGAVFRIANPGAMTSSSRAFSFADNGGFSAMTTGSSPSLNVGYSRIQSNSGVALPSGFAIIGFQQAGVLVSEASLPASSLMSSGRVFAEADVRVNTGIAIANPNSEPVRVSFHFTDSDGTIFGVNSITLAAGRQIAEFVTAAPFNGGNFIFGTFTFSAPLPVAVAAIRVSRNERAENLISALPVTELAASNEPLTVAHFADGRGWTTQLVLVNRADNTAAGAAQFISPVGQVLRASPYVLPPRSAIRMRAAGLGTVQSGYVRIAPADGAETPSAFVVFDYSAGGVTIAETIAPAVRSGAVFGTYIERGGNVQTAIAIANPSPSPVTANLEIFRLDGTPSGAAAALNIAANSQRSFFLAEIPQLAGLAPPFQCVLRVSSSSPVSVTILRTRVNERGDFLATALPPADESFVVSSSELLFPHFADGAGYSTQFVLFGRPSSGTVYFFDQTGRPVNVLFR